MRTKITVVDPSLAALVWETLLFVLGSSLQCDRERGMSRRRQRDKERQRQTDRDDTEREPLHVREHGLLLSRKWKCVALVLHGLGQSYQEKKT